MHSEVTVHLASNQEFRIDLKSAEPMDHEAGRRWLDEQFLALDCEPLRASGKVLLADAAWSHNFARATSAALARPVVRVDVAGMAVTF